MPFFLKRYGHLLLVILLPTAVLFPVCGHDFLAMDDSVNVFSNDLITHVSWANLLEFWQAPFEKLYIPLTYSTWGILAKISQILHPQDPHSLDPLLFHGANLLFHLLATVLVFHILAALLNQWQGGLFGALLFALHPVQLEAVAWVTGLKDVLYGFFLLLGLLLYIRFCRASDSGRTAWPLYLAATLAYALALLSKPAAIVFPLVAGALGYFTLARNWRRLVYELAPWLLGALPVAAITRSLQSGTILQFIPDYGQRLLVAGDALTFYLYKIILPLHLTIDYGRTPEYVLPQPWIWLTGLIPFVALAILFWKYRRPWILLTVALFLFPLLPVLGLVPFNFQHLSTVADRYLYLPMLGISYCAAWLVSHYRSKGVLVAAIAVVSLCGIRTAFLVPVWKNTDTVFTHAVTINPDSWNSYFNFGLLQQNPKQADTAIVNFNKALAIRPNTPKIIFELGNTYSLQKDFPAAISAYRRVIQLMPEYTDAYNMLGRIYYDRGDKQAALEYFARAAAVAPDSRNAAEYYASMGMIYGEAGAIENGLTAYRKALSLNPYLDGIYSSFGNFYLQLNQTDLALDMFQKAIGINPKDVVAYNGLGISYSMLGRTTQAVAAFEQAIALQPEGGSLYMNLAHIYFDMKRYDLAIQYADKAKDFGVVDPDLDTMLLPFRRNSR